MTAAKPNPPRLPLIQTPDDPLAREQFDKLAAGRGILNLHRMMAYAPTLMKASGEMALAFRHKLDPFSRACRDRHPAHGASRR